MVIVGIGSLARVSGEFLGTNCWSIETFWMYEKVVVVVMNGNRHLRYILKISCVITERSFSIYIV